MSTPTNLGRQAMGEFQQFVAPDTGRKFTEVYNVQHLTSNTLDSVARVTICTIQRLYSILRGEELDEDIDEKSGYEIFSALESGSNESGSGVSPLKSRDGSSTLQQGGNGVSPLGNNRFNRSETERFKAFTYEELIKRDKVNLDIFWLKDDALEESANLPSPEIIAQDITADLAAALEQFATIAEDLKG